MLEKKATATQLNNLAGLLGSENRELRLAITQLQDNQDEFDTRQRDFENRLKRYATRLTSIMGDLQNFQGVIDHNAQMSQNLTSVVKTAFSNMEELKTAVELLATEAGVAIDVLPEIAPVITVQPGLPERLGLTPLTKAEKKAVLAVQNNLPAPIELSPVELNRGLQLVR